MQVYTIRDVATDGIDFFLWGYSIHDALETYVSATFEDGVWVKMQRESVFMDDTPQD